MKQDYEKIKTAIRYWMLGRDYNVALAAMEYGLSMHTGVRKDGTTPEFQHQVSQANYCRTLAHSLLYPEETLATVFLHDVVEDTDATLDDVRDVLEINGNANQDQIERVLLGVKRMTNQHSDGTKKPKSMYYGAMQDPISSIAKGCDRIHNHQSMIGVFTIEKQKSYIEETQEYILPMLKDARKMWPQQEAAYQNIKHVLQTQMELVEAIIESETGVSNGS